MSNDIPYQLIKTPGCGLGRACTTLYQTGTPDTAQARSKTRRSVVYERNESCVKMAKESAWALACGRQLAVTCKRTWGSAVGHRRDFMVGCTRTVAAVTSCMVDPDRRIVPHLADRTHFDCARWTCRVTQHVQRTPLWLVSWLLALDMSRGSKSAEVHWVWKD